MANEYLNEANVKTILGLFLIAIGILLGLYVGLWLCVVGGVVDLINICKSPLPATNSALTWAIVKIVFSETFGFLFACIPLLAGFNLLRQVK